MDQIAKRMNEATHPNCCETGKKSDGLLDKFKATANKVITALKGQRYETFAGPGGRTQEALK